MKKLVFFVATLCTLLVSSCAGMVSPAAKVHPTATPSIGEQPMTSPHRVVEVWLNTTSTYPREYFIQAKQQIAQHIDNAVQPGEGTLVTISLIGSNSFSSEATVLTIAIPKIDPAPQSPTATGDPFADAKGRKTNATAKEQYQARLTAARKDVRALTDKLRSLNPPVDIGTPDLWGAFGRAAKRFEDIQAEKHLIWVTSLDSTTWAQFTPNLFLPHVNVSVIYAYCVTTQAACEQSTAFWHGAFLHAGASSVAITDPAQSSSSTISLVS